MSLDALLNQTCIISRNDENGKDRYNNATYMPTEIGRDIRCRKTQRTVRIADPLTAEYAYVHADLVLLPAGTDVKYKDEITIGSQVWVAQQVLGRQAASAEHHVSVIVEALNG